MNGEITRIPRLLIPHQKVKKENKDWADNRKLTENILEFALNGRLLLGADSEVHTLRLRASETNERRMAKFSESMESSFVGRNAAVLQYTQFAYADESTRRRMSNVAIPKPGRFEEEWAKLDLAPMVMRGKAELIVMSVKKESATSWKLLTRTALAPFGCEEVKITKASQLAS